MQEGVQKLDDAIASCIKKVLTVEAAVRPEKGHEHFVRSSFKIKKLISLNRAVCRASVMVYLHQL